MQRKASTLDMDFLKARCLRPWSKFEIGGMDPDLQGGSILRVNHIYIECDVPFLISASSLSLPGQVEEFGICLVTEGSLIKTFLQGPHPPYNKPDSLSLLQLVGSKAEAFMGGIKQINLLNTSEIDKCVFLLGGGLEVSIYADDEVPMSLLLAWNLPSRFRLLTS